LKGQHTNSTPAADFLVGCVAAPKVAGASLAAGNQCHLGIGVMAIYLTAGGVSGAHLNPAVTIALWLLACSGQAFFIPPQRSNAPALRCGFSLRVYYNLFSD